MLPRYKDIMDLIKKGSTLEAQEKIIELREAAPELQEENLNLKEELSKLKRQMQEQESLHFDGDVYWSGNGDQKEGPFCPKCYDTQGQKVRLHADGLGWWCYTCQIHYGPSERYT